MTDDFDNARHRFYDAVEARERAAAETALADMRKATVDLEVELLGDDVAAGTCQFRAVLKLLGGASSSAPTAFSARAALVNRTLSHVTGTPRRNDLTPLVTERHDVDVMTAAPTWTS